MGPVEWLFLLSLTPKRRVTHLANMPGFALETTAASAQEDMREKPANMQTVIQSVKMVENAFDLENADVLQDLEENSVTKWFVTVAVGMVGCRNGGSCVAPGICSCPEGWIGGACHTAVCKKPCVNGGKCVSPNTCRCRAPFSGPQCEERKKLF
ncbi:hypothetical protein Q8A67_018121 [Cirrhinus molitorella]|uniref:EGF-like domain-containing protein n=1 Tax=Cirrhinus molitorella TaxID=172907 RepID=A0AA88PDT4_9TELE|nr:hypothetical protein Q8A67_018121 [Cirrhinus molitorella]